jgi:hypothetical protein
VGRCAAELWRYAALLSALLFFAAPCRGGEDMTLLPEDLWHVSVSSFGEGTPRGITVSQSGSVMTLYRPTPNLCGRADADTVKAIVELLTKIATPLGMERIDAVSAGVKSGIVVTLTIEIPKRLTITNYEVTISPNNTGNQPEPSSDVERLARAVWKLRDIARESCDAA